MVLEIPKEMISLPTYSEQDFKIDVAVMLYQRKVLTLARAAHWVDMTRFQFQKVLADRSVPINYGIEDFQFFHQPRSLSIYCK